MPTKPSKQCGIAGISASAVNSIERDIPVIEHLQVKLSELLDNLEKSISFVGSKLSLYRKNENRPTSTQGEEYPAQSIFCANFYQQLQRLNNLTSVLDEIMDDLEI